MFKEKKNQKLLDHFSKKIYVEIFFFKLKKIYIQYILPGFSKKCLTFFSKKGFPSIFFFVSKSSETYAIGSFLRGGSAERYKGQSQFPSCYPSKCLA